MEKVHDTSAFVAPLALPSGVLGTRSVGKAHDERRVCCEFRDASRHGLKEEHLVCNDIKSGSNSPSGTNTPTSPTSTTSPTKNTTTTMGLQYSCPGPNCRRDCRARLQTMVHSKQTGFGAACDLHLYLRNGNRDKQKRSSSSPPSFRSFTSAVPVSVPVRPQSGSGSGSGSRRRRLDSVVDCYVMPRGEVVVIQPGF